MPRVRIDKHDLLFSRFIRTRDGWKCVRCGKQKEQGDASLHNSHYITRGAWATRYDEENCDALCWGCHHYWGGRGREEYKEFKIKQLGEEGFNALIRRSNDSANKRKLREMVIEKYSL